MRPPRPSRGLAVAAALVGLIATAGGATAQGFRGEYYRGDPGYPHLPGPPLAVRVDPTLGFSDRGEPGTQAWALPPGLEADRFTVRWSAEFTPSVAGPHRFELACTDDGVLIVDGVIAIDLRGLHGRQRRDVTLTLGAGPHLVELYHGEHGGERFLSLDVVPPSGATLGAFRPDVTFGAAARTVDFDRLPGDTALSDQLLASDGVRFVNDFVDGVWWFTSRPTVTRAWRGFTTSSPPNVLRGWSRGVESAESISADVPLTAVFAQPQARVAVRVGSSVRATAVGAPRAAWLLAYDGAGRLIAADRLAPVSDQTTAVLQVMRGAGDIASVGISFGDSPFDEVIDDLRYEARPGATATADLTAPVVTIETPTSGQVVYSPHGLAVRAVVREASGVVASVVATGGAAPVALWRSSPTPACAPPGCGVYEGTVDAAHGPVRLTVTARDGAGNSGSAQVDLRLVRRTVVHVVDENDRDVVGAELLIDGVRHPQVTDATGRITLANPLRAGAALIARVRVFERWSPRANHAAGSTQNWAFRVYNTSLPVALSGATTPATIVDPVAEQRLQVRRDQSVLGVHLVLSVEWDASAAELAALTPTYLQPASDWLYNATDGQMVIERVDVVDQGQGWGDTDFRLFTDWTLRAHVPCRRAGFLFDSVWCGTWMNMARSDVAWVYTHEFGHFGLDLGDEYTDERGALCTAAIAGSDPQFGRGGGKQACLMAAGFVGKLCSAHADNPHLTGTQQGDTSCWAMVAERFRDEERARGFLQRWFINTPTGRGGIVDRLPAMPVAWRVAPVIDNRRSAGLCAPSTVSFVLRGTTTPAVGVEIWQRTTDGRSILQGKTDPMGQLRVTGFHLGDRLEAPGHSAIIGPSDCTSVAP